MQSVSAAMIAELNKSSFTAVAYADFYLRGNFYDTIPILTGSTTDDAKAIQRSRASLVFSGATEELIVPTATDWQTNPLWPLGNEVQLKAGVRYQNGFEELVPAGRFRITRPQFGHTEGDRTISVDGVDRMRALERAKLTDAYHIPEGYDWASAMKLFLMDRLVWLTDSDFGEWMDTSGVGGTPVYVTPDIIYLPEDDPAQKMTDMAKAIGAEFFFDLQGQPVLRTTPDPLYDESQIDLVTGARGRITGIVRELDDEDTYNGVQVTGASSSNTTPVSYTAWNLDRNSPTYYDPAYPTLSDYGPNPFFIQSDLVTTEEQARVYATTELYKMNGVLEGVEVNLVPYYPIEVGDVGLVQDAETGVNSVQVFDQRQCPLGFDGSMVLTGRRRRLAA